MTYASRGLAVAFRAIFLLTTSHATHRIRRQPQRRRHKCVSPCPARCSRRCPQSPCPLFARPNGERGLRVGDAAAATAGVSRSVATRCLLVLPKANAGPATREFQVRWRWVGRSKPSCRVPARPSGCARRAPARSWNRAPTSTKRSRPAKAAANEARAHTQDGESRWQGEGQRMTGGGSKAAYATPARISWNRIGTEAAHTRERVKGKSRGVGRGAEGEWGGRLTAPGLVSASRSCC